MRPFFKRTIILFFATTLMATMAKGQGLVPQEWRDHLELWGEWETGGIAEDEIEELYNHYSENPVNLNDTTGMGIGVFFFITPLQQATLKAYIEQQGTLLSIEELSLINGFDEATIALLRPLVYAGPETTAEKFRWHDMLRYGRHSVVAGSNGTIERARGYREEKYEGSPQRLYFLYQFKYKDYVQLQLSGDKDPGEAFFSKSQKQGFDHYGYSLMIGEAGIVKRAIVGRYNLQFGQGTTLWTGFAPYSSMSGCNYRSAQGIRTASAFAEYNYLNGAAATIEPFRHITFTGFYANTSLDATTPSNLEGTREDGYELVQSLYESGYHRTATEIGKADALKEQLWGGNIQYNNDRLHIGLTAYKMLYDKKIRPGNYRYNYYYFKGYHNQNLGVDFGYRLRRLLLYGELSMDERRHRAGIIGAEILVSGNHRLGLYYRDYDAYYWNQHATGSGMGSGTRNEKGLCANLQATLPWGLRVLAAIDGAYFPEMRYNAYGASKGLEGRLRMTRNVGKHLNIAIQYRNKRQGSNVKEGQNYTVGAEQRHQLQCDLRLIAGGIQSTTRIAYTNYHIDGSGDSDGYLVYQDFQYRSRRIPLTLAARLCLFDIKDYDARIYTMESGIAYDNSTVYYMDRGERFYIVVHYDIGAHISIGAKYSITNYSNRDAIGSGYEMIDSPYRQQWKVQLRLHF